MKKSFESEFKMNSGAATIILLITVIGLSVFASLAIKAAYSEKHLAGVSADKLAEYYTADARAEEIVFAVRESSAAGHQYITDTEADITELEYSDGSMACYHIDVNDTSYIELILSRDPDAYCGIRVDSRRLVVPGMEGYAAGGFEIVDSFPLR